MSYNKGMEQEYWRSAMSEHHYSEDGLELLDAMEIGLNLTEYGEKEGCEEE